MTAPVRQISDAAPFAFFDVLAGPNQPIHFPVPWASDPSFSFLLSPDETRELITRAGFRETTWLADEALEIELERPDPLADDAGPGAPLDPGLLNGPDAPRMGKNVGRNSDEGRILPVLGVFERI